MIGRPHRFHGYNSVRRVYKQGTTVRGPLLALKYSRNERRRSYRAAVVVSRKVHKSAVVRNRLRRRVYEAVRQHGPALDGPHDLVFTVFSEQLLEVTPAELQKIVSGLLAKAGLLPDGSAGHAIVEPKERP